MAQFGETLATVVLQAARISIRTRARSCWVRLLACPGRMAHLGDRPARAAPKAARILDRPQARGRLHNLPLKSRVSRWRWCSCSYLGGVFFRHAWDYGYESEKEEWHPVNDDA